MLQEWRVVRRQQFLTRPSLLPQPALAGANSLRGLVYTAQWPVGPPVFHRSLAPKLKGQNQLPMYFGAPAACTTRTLDLQRQS